MELEITWARVLRVWWGWLWRNLIAIVVAGASGVIIGAIVGGILAVSGASIETVQLVATPLGVILGLALTVVPIKLILGRSFGEFRVVLLSNIVGAQPGAASDRPQSGRPLS